MSEKEFIYYLLQMLKIDLENDANIDSFNNIVLSGGDEKIIITAEEV